ncbi:MAG: hypothetical protein WBE68_26110 [Candidatus Nitrosopolaris sp.]
MCLLQQVFWCFLGNSHTERDWLNGKPRDTIACDNSLSAGSVSGIISEWRNALTYPVADALRELGIMLRKSRITASQCALGFKLASIMKENGVGEDNFGLFISDVYNKCKNIGIQPEYISYNMKQILDLAGSIPLSYDSKLIGLKSEIDKTNNELIILQKNLANKNQVAKALGELILMGLDDQQILNLAWALQSNISNKESLEADLKKYGSLKNSIEELNQELRLLESQNKQMESRDRLNMPKDLLEIWEMQECTILAALVEVAIGEKVEINRLRTSIIETINLAIRSPDASYIFKKAIDMINVSDKARMMIDNNNIIDNNKMIDH